MKSSPLTEKFGPISGLIFLNNLWKITKRGCFYSEICFLWRTAETWLTRVCGCKGQHSIRLMLTDRGDGDGYRNDERVCWPEFAFRRSSSSSWSLRIANLTIHRQTHCHPRCSRPMPLCHIPVSHTDPQGTLNISVRRAKPYSQTAFPTCGL